MVKLYKNIYIYILKFIPIDFHPILRLVNKSWNSIIINKYSRINKLLKYADISLLQFISEQQNIVRFVLPNNMSSPYTILSLLEAGKYNRVDIMIWLKENSSTFDCCPPFQLKIGKLINKCSESALIWLIDNLFFPNSHSYNWFIKYGKKEHIELFLNNIIKKNIDKQSHIDLRILASMCGKINYFEYPNDEDYGCHDISIAIKTSNTHFVSKIDKYILNGNFCNFHWMEAIETNNIEILDYFYSKNIPVNLEFCSFKKQIEKSTLHWLIDHDVQSDSSIYISVISLPEWLECFEKLYKKGHHPNSSIFSEIFGSKYDIEQIKWLINHGAEILKGFYDEFSYNHIYYHKLLKNGNLNIFKYWHNIYYPNYVEKVNESIFFDLIMNSIMYYHRTDVLSYLLSQKYFENYTNRTLKTQSFFNHKILKMLLDNGWKPYMHSFFDVIDSGKYLSLELFNSLYPLDVFDFNTILKVLSILKAPSILWIKKYTKLILKCDYAYLDKSNLYYKVEKANFFETEYPISPQMESFENN